MEPPGAVSGSGGKRIMMRKLLCPVYFVFRHLRNKLILGVLLLVPLIASCLILVWAFNWVDNILQPVIVSYWGKTYPGIGVGIVLVFAYLTGLLASSLLGKRIIELGENLLQKIPIFKYIYRGIKQIIISFTEPRKNGFMQVVFIEYPRKGIHSVGFLTNELHTENEETLYTVFIPTSPNPTSGYLEVVREQELIRSTMSVEDALKVVVSAGKVPLDTKDLLKDLYNRRSED
jgi:uncharacterized membrane protein